jgi:hypothetical protein
VKSAHKPSIVIEANGTSSKTDTRARRLEADVDAGVVDALRTNAMFTTLAQGQIVEETLS